ncbi:MAG: glycosyltransferase [Rhodospirillaceae bacterium]|nr:glycosyltransferase [Rhodospirillaceae bacterium]
MVKARPDFPESRTSIVFVINSLAGGGAERVMSTLLKASSSEAATRDLHLVLLDIEPSAYSVPDWITLHQLDGRHALWRSTWQLLVLLRRLRPQAIVSFLTRANVASILAGRALRLPVVISERVNTTSHLGSGWGGKLARMLVKRCYPWAGRIIAVSPGVGEDLHRAFGLAREKVVVIANPIDLDEIERQSKMGDPPPVTRPYVMAMGRLVANKNFGMLIEAYGRANPEADLLILGEGPERSSLIKRIAELGLTDRVHLPGFSRNPFAMLRRAQSFILPSNAEGFPNSLLEAMSLGVPVVSTNCRSGPAEILADMPREAVAPGVVLAEHGILVTCDHVADMASAMQAMADPERRQAYGHKATRRAAQFSVGRAREAYWEIIHAERMHAGNC